MNVFDAINMILGIWYRKE